MAQERFYDILIHELEVEIRREIRDEFKNLSQNQANPRAYTEPTLDFIPRFFKDKKNTYRSKTANTKPYQKPELRMNRNLTTEERAHFEILSKLGAEIEENFCEKDLKREFRKLAHAYHPDHLINSNAAELKIAQARFSAAKSSYDELRKGLQK